jgi:hypothetical protein
MPIRAQSGAFSEVETEVFVIVSPPGTEEAARYYGERADPLFRALTSAFGIELETPISLRLHASEADYLAANPLFVEIGGVIAHARRGRREVEISVGRAIEGREAPKPETAHLGLDNALRTELGFLLSAKLAENRLPAGFSVGVAEYLALPDESRAPGVARLRDALRSDALHSWSALNAPGAEYLDPPLAQPQMLSVVHFLVERFGFDRLLRFLRLSAESSGWRNAIETTYGLQPSKLASDWQAWLPAYLDGGWRNHALYTLDLGPARAMIDRGDFGAAESLLGSVTVLMESIDAGAAAEARALLQLAEQGSAAQAAMNEALTALSEGDYPTALQGAEASAKALRDLGDRAGAGLADEVVARARIGMEAQLSMTHSQQLPPWRFAEARHASYLAMVKFGQVGNELLAADARQRVEQLDRRQAPFGIGLLLMGFGLIVWSARKRRADQVASST